MTDASKPKSMSGVLAACALLVGCGYLDDATGKRKLLPNPLPVEFPYEVVGTLRRVWMGNELQIDSGGATYYVLLQGVDNPNSTPVNEQHARDQLSRILGSAPVRIVVHERDEWERAIARAYSSDVDVNLELILSGYGRYDGTVFDGSDAFRSAEQSARQSKRGIWRELTE
jgi:endonuclease YncB( thermonuclease family)